MPGVEKLFTSVRMRSGAAYTIDLKPEAVEHSLGLGREFVTLPRVTLSQAAQMAKGIVHVTPQGVVMLRADEVEALIPLARTPYR